MTFDKPEKCSTIPDVVADDEIILRSADTRHFNKKGNVKSNIFKPPFGSREVSVMRFHYMSIGECKMRGKEIACKAKHDFKGFAALKCAAIRKAKAEIEDSRKHFLGHADIVYSNPRPPEALPNCAPEDLQAIIAFEEVVDQLVNSCKLFFDRNPTSEDWQGEEIIL